MSLPKEIIEYILTYDDHFILRGGKIVSIVSKKDPRYTLLQSVCRKEITHYTVYGRIQRFEYDLYNPFTCKERDLYSVENDNMSVEIEQMPKGVMKYTIYLFRLKPKEYNTDKIQVFYKGNLCDYNWHYIQYNYIRK